jgi:hypothetical protein
VKPVPETREALTSRMTYGDPGAAVALLRMGRRAQEIAPDLAALSVGVVADGLTFTLVADERAGPVDAVQYLAGGARPARRPRRGVRAHA